jgi:hypothetical protein
MSTMVIKLGPRATDANLFDTWVSFNFPKIKLRESLFILDIDCTYQASQLVGWNPEFRLLQKNPFSKGIWSNSLKFDFFELPVSISY